MLRGVQAALRPLAAAARAPRAPRRERPAAAAVAAGAAARGVAPANDGRRRLVTAQSHAAASETTFGILRLIEGEAGAADDGADADATGQGTVLSAAVGGVLRVALPGSVAVGQAVELPNDALGLVLRFDRRGAVVALVSGATPSTGAPARASGAPLAVRAVAAAAGGRATAATFASVAELLHAAGHGGGAARSPLALPAMPPPPRRRAVTRRLASGLAAAEALLPFGEGHRIGFVGPPTTGKTTAAQMLIGAQPEDTAVVYAAHRPEALLRAQIGPGLADNPNLTVVYSDPATDSLGARYLLPFCALHVANELRAQHRHVLLVLDDMVAFAQAAVELGTPPVTAAQAVAAALDAAGAVADAAGGERALSVAAVMDFDHEDVELPPHLRDLWRSTEPSLDVCLAFDLRLAADGVLPAIDAERLLAAGPPPSYQAALLRRIRGELMRFLATARDRRERLDMCGQLGLHLEPQDSEDAGSARVARALLAHATGRPLPELAVILAAALVYHFPHHGRQASRTAVAQFQEAVVATVRDYHPRLWEALQYLETSSDDEAREMLQALGQALMAHRFDFRLTRPEL